jgi:hypothetical protein
VDPGLRRNDDLEIDVELPEDETFQKLTREPAVPTEPATGRIMKTTSVIPAKAGIHSAGSRRYCSIDSGLRRNDDLEINAIGCRKWRTVIPAPAYRRSHQPNLLCASSALAGRMHWGSSDGRRKRVFCFRHCRALTPVQTVMERYSMGNTRNGDAGAPPIRQERFFKRGNYWYFATREGAAIGPYDNLEHAQAGARHYVDLMKDTPETAAVIRSYA